MPRRERVKLPQKIASETNIIMEKLKNFKYLKILIIYSFQDYIIFTGEYSNKLIKYSHVSQFMKSYQGKIFQKKNIRNISFT